MRVSFNTGDLVVMTDDAIENYGDEYVDTVFIIEHVATKYMPSEEFFRRNMPDGYHPGFDEASTDALYDLNYAEGGAFGSSLYDWELRHVN